MDREDGHRFTGEMARVNGLSDFARWIFFRGMGFGEENLWWGACKKRLTLHEGLDLCAWEGSGGKVGRIGAGAKVPAMAGGVVRHVGPDFLGHSIWIDLGGAADERGDALHLVYAHVTPVAHLSVGMTVRCGEVVAAVAGTRGAIPAHLHVSLARLSRRVPKEMLAWEKLAAAGVRFIDPLPIFAGDCRVGWEEEKPW